MTMLQRSGGGGMRFSLATIYDVSQDDWLGKSNGFFMIASGERASQALVLRSGGQLSAVCKAGKALRHAQRVGRLVDPANEPDAQCIVEVTRELRFQDAVLERNDGFYRALTAGERFVIVQVQGMKARHETVTKALADEVFPGEHGLYAYLHTKDDQRQGKWTGYSNKFKPRSIVLLSEAESARWHGLITIQAAKAGHTEAEHDFSVGSINSEALRVAHAIGARATPYPFDVESRCARVEVGRDAIFFQQNSIDMMNVRVFANGVGVSSREDLPSIRMSHERSGGILASDYVYSELGCAAYEDWLHYRAARKAGATKS